MRTEIKVGPPCKPGGGGGLVWGHAARKIFQIQGLRNAILRE